MNKGIIFGLFLTWLGGVLIGMNFQFTIEQPCDIEAYRQEGREQMADMLSKTLIPDLEKLP